ncbi:hypothetical protein [Thermoanaerobacter siderophilus]|uniref:hypothetical protein n=1 Tax=Thermoanaerobacter siderophilus TaxID=106578 RepID=UPI0002E49CE9|nr:hypothetical protein [Thermoanaerobacter siderophilus]
MSGKDSELVFRNLNLTLEQFENCLNNICVDNNIFIEEKESKNNGKEIHYKVFKNLIRVYVTKKGLTIDCSICRDENLRQIISNELKKYLIMLI